MKRNDVVGILFAVALLGFSSSANAQKLIDIYVCDHCDNEQAMEVVAIQEALPTVCAEAPNIKGESGESNGSAVRQREAIVANPYNQMARKFVVQATEQSSGCRASIRTQPMHSDEQAILATLYGLEKVVRDATAALNKGPGSVSRHTAAEDFQKSCLTSAAAHVFSSKEHKRKLEGKMGRALMDEIAVRHQNTFASMAPRAETRNANLLTIAAGSDLQGVIHYDYKKSRQTLIPVGGAGCLPGNACTGLDPEDVIIYDVVFSGNLEAGNTNNELQLDFVMNLNTSTIDGVAVGMIMDRGVHRADKNPASCLAKLVASIDATSPLFVAEETLSGPQPIVLEGDKITGCLAAKSIRACVERGNTSPQRCSIVDMYYYKQCADDRN